MPEAEKLLGVLLTAEAIEELGEAIRPCLQECPFGGFCIYGTSVEQEGDFLHVAVHPGHVGNRIPGPVEVWIPVHHVVMIAGGEDEETLRAIGFAPPPTCEPD